MSERERLSLRLSTNDHQQSVEWVAQQHAAASLIEIRKQTDRMRGIAQEMCFGEWLQFVNEQLDDLDSTAEFTMNHVAKCIVKGRRSI